MQRAHEFYFLTWKNNLNREFSRAIFKVFCLNVVNSGTQLTIVKNKIITFVNKFTIKKTTSFFLKNYSYQNNLFFFTFFSSSFTKRSFHFSESEKVSSPQVVAVQCTNARRKRPIGHATPY